MFSSLPSPTSHIHLLAQGVSAQNNAVYLFASIAGALNEGITTNPAKRGWGMVAGNCDGCHKYQGCWIVSSTKQQRYSFISFHSTVHF